MNNNTQLNELIKVLRKLLTDEWTAQGHNMSGKLIETIEYVVEEAGAMLTISGMMLPYGAILNSGTPRARIPYSGNSGRGGTSMYIQALQSWIQARMNITDEKKSLSIAFAIAKTQKREGMPTIGSYNFSSNGMRLYWIEEALSKGEDAITTVLRDMCWEILSVKLEVLLTKWQYEFNH
jgi:hypothetical protein